MSPVSSRLRSFAERLRTGLLAALLFLAACAPAPRARSPRPPGRASACIVVDTDAGLDDFRALVALAQTRPVAGVVVTEGIATPAGGAAALQRLIGPMMGTSRIIPGAASASPPSWDWLPEVRRNAERLNGVLPEPASAPTSGRPLEQVVEEWVRECAEVRVLLLGPWTSFVRYRPRLGPRMTRVIAQGLPFREAAERQRFNCGYDLRACVAVTRQYASSPTVIWVDLPRDPPPLFAPTRQLVEQLPLSGPAGMLRRLLLANEHSWTGALMWDEAAVLYLLRPDGFGVVRDHVEPRVSPEELRQRWLEAVARPSR